MQWLSGIKRLLGFGNTAERVEPVSRQVIRGRYDNAQTSDENSRHWAMVDGLSARSANSPIVRKRLRDRMRYEIANNPLAEGMVTSYANDVIATGPRLQLNTGHEAFDEFILRPWRRWAKAIRLTSKLRLNVRSKLTDGEAFNQFITNDKLKTPVKLDIKPFEAEMCTTPTENLAEPFRIDGINFDDAGNATEFRILKQHPGDLGPNFYEGVWVPAAYITHWFKCSRPGQVRGVPENHSSLQLFACRRRFMLATLSAAETAASFGGVIETETPPGEADTTDPLSTVDLDRNTVLTLPAGNKFHQVTSEHPNDTFPTFNKEIIRETGRPIGQPYNVTAGDSSDHNYASGRLDHQQYWNVIDITREDCEDVVLDRVFQAWFAEYRLTDEFATFLAEPHGASRGSNETTGASAHRLGNTSQTVSIIDAMELVENGAALEWEWDGHPHVDPVKEENATETRLSNGTTSYDTECASNGRNRRMEWAKQAKALGMKEKDYQAAMRTKFFGVDPLAPVVAVASGEGRGTSLKKPQKPVEPDEPARSRNRMPVGGRT